MDLCCPVPRRRRLLGALPTKGDIGSFVDNNGGVDVDKGAGFGAAGPFSRHIHLDRPARTQLRLRRRPTAPRARYRRCCRPGGANVLTYISGFEATFSTPTAGITITITVTVATLIGSVTLNYTVQALAAGAAVQPPAPLVVEFNPPIPANALNSAITVSVPALGAGAPGVSVAAHGFQLPMSS
jgi:hypothetical protein